MITTTVLTVLTMSGQIMGAPWSWKNFISNSTTSIITNIHERPALWVAGTAAAVAATFGLYSYFKTNKQRPIINIPSANLAPISEQNKQDANKPVLSNKRLELKDFLTMLRNAAERDLFRLDCILKENMTGSIDFDCVAIWEKYPEFAAKLQAIEHSIGFVRGFNKSPLTTKKDVLQTHANLRAFQKEVEIGLQS